MSEKGLEALKAIIQNTGGKEIDFVVVGTDKNVINDFSNEIIQLSKKYKITTALHTELFFINTKYVIAISWRWLITIENFTLITLHDSLLPKYRGFAPLVSQLLNREKCIGVSAILTTAEYDKGNVLEQASVAIEYPIKIQQAIEHMAQLCSKVTIKIIQQISNGEALKGLPQKEENATYSLWRDEEDYKIDWNNTAADIRLFVDSVSFPYRGAKTYLGKKTIRIFEVKEIEDVQIENRNPGKVIFVTNNRPVAVCGSGLLQIIDAKYEDSCKSIFPLNKFRIRFK